MLDASQVSACLVTRGDQPEMMERILASLLPYDEVIVWDNAERDDHMTAGRFMAMAEARNDICYTQDDDVIVPHATQQALLTAWEPSITAAYGHGDNDGGYGDLALVGGGGLCDGPDALDAIHMYCEEYGEWDRDEEAYADFIVGVLLPHKQLRLPFEINYPVAQHPSRLCNQPWAAGAKRRVTERARAIRDAA